MTRTGTAGGMFVAFPEYRPDLAKIVATRLELPFYDLRAEIMVPKAMDGGTLGFNAVQEVLADLARQGGAVVFNVEALLSTKTEAQREEWMRTFIRGQWGAPLVLPLTLYAQEAVACTDRILSLEGEQLPPQKFINRFVN